MVEKRRVGKFTIEASALDGGPMLEDVKAVMRLCVVVRAEMMYSSHRIEYQAISDHFDEIEIGELIPLYNWHVTRHEGGLRTARAERVK